MRSRFPLALVLALAAAVALGITRAPAPRDLSAPPSEFSAARAMIHLAAIAREPHPTGTAAADAVRAYLVRELEAHGWSVEVQDTTSLSEQYARRWGIPVVAARVRNVVARRKGAAPGPALALMAHYDSRELTPGASDDGYGVAALLETARALSAGPALRHDVLLVVTEGEEIGLLGARAFFAEHPAARDVALVLNFEARGDRGPVTMFQTSAGASGLVEVLARAAPDVVASSLTQEAYRRMPNDTDLTVALEAGKAGMNFANIDGFERYHQASDTVANASPATLQHHGDYALSLARAFGDAEPMFPSRAPSAGESVYFDLGPAFVRYPARAAIPLALAAVAALGVALVGAVRSGAARGRGLALGLLRASLALLAAGLLAATLGWLLMKLRGDVLAAQELRPAVKDLYATGFLVLGGGTAWGALALGRRRPAVETAAGGAALWAILALGTAALLPGGSYPFTGPVAVAAGALLLPPGRARAALEIFAAALALALLAPLAHQLSLAFGPPLAPALAPLGALALLAAAARLDPPGAARRAWIGPAALGGAGAACVAAALALPPFDAGSPRPDSLTYEVDADRGEGSWLSLDGAPDAWTARALAGARAASVADVFPRDGRERLRAPAPRVPVDPPRLERLSEARDGATRTLHLRAWLPPGTEIVELTAPPSAHVTAASVQGRAFGAEGDGWLDLAFFGPPAEGLDLVIVTVGAEALPLRVVAARRGLPAALASTLGPRPPGVMPKVGRSALRSSDMTLVAAGITW